MGKLEVRPVRTAEERSAFTRALLEDVQALERMLEEGRIESGIRRIGAEQEIFLVDRGCRPAPVAMRMLERLDDPEFTTELALFNLEANLEPLELGGRCLRRLEARLHELIESARRVAAELDADVLLTGILPTLQLSDLSLENLTPLERYRLLNDALSELRGGKFRFSIKGIDEFFAVHDNVMLESCNTSFQLHYQVEAGEFARLYNVAQLIAAPLLAIAANSPLLVQKRLWHETRVALFERSIDERTDTQMERGQPPRVSFGDRWVESSVLEIFRDSVARHRPLLGAAVDERPHEVLDRGEAPLLRALLLHNGTTYRWNRACYGSDGEVAHLRVETRILPAGPTIADEVANAALFYGLMAALPDEYGEFTKSFPFEDARVNFLTAARHGPKASLTWIDGRVLPATELILDHLLPLARQGLEASAIDAADIDRYLGIIEERARTRQTGSQWLLASLARLDPGRSGHARCRALTEEYLKRQKTGEPVHTWPLASPAKAADWRHDYRTVEQCMTRDLVTVQADDLVDLAANLMEWVKVRHLPVENGEGRLVGMLTHRSLVRLLTRRERDAKPVTAGEIMERDLPTVTPDAGLLEAVRLMQERKSSALPVVKDHRLVGILTERDLIDLVVSLLSDEA